MLQTERAKVVYKLTVRYIRYAKHLGCARWHIAVLRFMAPWTANGLLLLECLNLFLGLELVAGGCRDAGTLTANPPANRWPLPGYMVTASGHFVGSGDEDKRPQSPLAMAVPSRNGRYVAYVSRAGEVRLQDRHRRTDEMLSAFGSFPTWSADGTQLAWIGSEENENSAYSSYPYTRNMRTGEVTVFDKAYPYFGGGLTWSPDGDKLCYADGGMHSTDLMIIGRSTGKQRPLPAAPSGWHHWWPSWSPDGRRIAYVCFDTHHSAELDI